MSLSGSFFQKPQTLTQILDHSEIAVVGDLIVHVEHSVDQSTDDFLRIGA